jgi:hypothetical protein
MIARIINWFNLEPAVSVLMVATAIVLFGSAFQAYKETSGKFWPWVRKVIEASIGALLFLGLLWSFRAILNDNMYTFYSTHGSVSDISRASAWSIWGRPHTQSELTVHHYHDVEIKEEIPREDITAAPVYRTVMQRQEVQQNSIIGFTGDIDMQLSERQKGYALYSGYTLDVLLNYQIINDSQFKTDAQFAFPLSPGQTLFEDFKVLVNGNDISSKLHFSGDIVYWAVWMSPQEKMDISISYLSRGMDTFYYQIPAQREISNFKLTLTIDQLPISMLNYPDGIITPTKIVPTKDGNGSILTWELDHAITTSGMGVALPQPEQPGAKVMRVLIISPYALTLLTAILALTMLIWGMKVQFLDLALLSAVYTMEFLIMSSLSDYFLGFWGSLIIGALATLLLSYFLFKKIPSKPLKTIIFSLIAFFTIIYPLSGLQTELTQQNSFNMLMQVGMIIYIAGLSIFAIRNKANDKTLEEEHE